MVAVVVVPFPLQVWTRRACLDVPELGGAKACLDDEADRRGFIVECPTLDQVRRGRFKKSLDHRWGSHLAADAEQCSGCRNGAALGSAASEASVIRIASAHGASHIWRRRVSGKSFSKQSSQCCSTAASPVMISGILAASRSH